MDDKEYQTRQAFEHQLINHRLTWLLSSQSVFFASLAIVLAKEIAPRYEHYRPLFLKTLSGLGISISAAILIGVVMGICAKCISYKDQHKKDKNTKWGVRPWITTIALIPDVSMPIGFIVAWIYIYSKS